jgi:putative ABC transport system permease protein
MTRFRGNSDDELRARAEREIDDELTFHLDHTIAELEERGLTRGEAEAEAQRRFGPPHRHRRSLVDLEILRQSGERRRASMEVLRTSVRSVRRGFRRSPGFTFGVLAILTLGLGVNAITFGLVDRLILSGPAGISRPDELRRVVVHRQNRSGADVATTEMGYPEYRDLLTATQLAGVAAEAGGPALFGSGESAEPIQASLVTANYFSLLGVATPAVGRFFTAPESEQEGARVAVLSHAFWRRRYGSDPTAIGQLLLIESERYTVIGVAPQYFTGTAVARVDVFLPLEAASDVQVQGPWRTSRNFSWLTTVVRVAPGVADAQAAAEITALHQQASMKPADGPGERPGRLELAPLNAVRGVTASNELSVAALVGSVALLVLLIAFANVANLFLGRTLRHRDALAVRVALGGGRSRLVAEEAVQGALIALAGSSIAVLVAATGARPIQSLLFPNVYWLETPVNLRVIAFLACCATVGGAIAAALPVWHVGRSDVVRWLRTSNQRASRTRTQSLILVVQGALSVLLLVGAGLFVRSLTAAQSLEVGIDASRLLVVSALGGETQLRPDFQTDLRAAVEKIPGVARTTRAEGTIPFVSSWVTRMNVPGLAERPGVDDGGPYIHSVEPGYFETVGTAIVEGRSFTSADREGAPLVAVVNRTMARLYWPGENAIGKCIEVGADKPSCTTVVGIAENTRRQEIVEGDSLLYYIPMDQAPTALRGGRLLVRIQDSEESAMARVAETIRREALLLEPRLRYVTARPLDDVISPQLRAWRLGASLFSVFGLLALTVASVGLYSVVAFDVEGRRREIGIRAALGAPSAAILRLVVRDGMRVAAGGLTLGLVLAWLLAPLLSNLLYGVAPQDAVVYLTVTVALLTAALVASAGPAFSASQIEPSQALRDE